MSLRVWLPLNGTLDNQGLDNVVVTNNGATVDNSGKIGKCYSFDGSNDYISFPYSFPSEDWSYSIWFYTTATTTQTLGCCRSAGGLGFSVFLISKKIRIDGIIDSSNQEWTVNYTYPINTWVNLIITSKNGLIKYYINGEHQESKNITRDISKLGNIFSIGASQVNGSSWGNYFKGKINDVRIYNHALSPLEVKQISQGLILHYPLNNNGFGQKNLLPISDSTIINSTKSFEFQGWVQSFYTKTWMNEHLVPGKQYILSYTVTCLSIPDSTYIFKENRHSPILVHQGGGLNQVTITNDGIKNTRMSVGQSRSYKCIFTFSTIPEENKEYYGLCGYTALYRNSSNAAQYAKFRIDNLKLEEGEIATPWCPNEADELYNQLGLNNNIQYDTSGYKNNGIKTGTFIYDSDTPKCNVSMVFNGVDNCIQIGNLYSIFSNPFSINLWFKKEVIGSKKYETLIGGASGFEMDTRNGASQTLSLYMTSTRGGNAYSPFEFNNWYMVTMVNNGTHELYYINGILAKTIEKKNMPNSNYYIGAWNTSTQQNFKGNMSDFRIYCTALSAEDVLSLYNNSAYIDNQGNIYGAIYEEV